MKTKQLLKILLTLFIMACQKDASIAPKEYAYILTNNVVDNNNNGLTLSASLVDKGKSEITDFGFIYYDYNSQKTIFSLKNDGGNINDFQKRFYTEFQKGHTYYYKAYVKQPGIMVYGKTISFICNGSSEPKIISIEPSQGYIGDVININGKFFSSDSTKNELYIGGRKVQLIRSSSTLLVFKIPQLYQSGPQEIKLRVNDKEYKTNKIFTLKAPKITSISTVFAKSGTIMEILGENMTQNSENIELKFDTKISTILEATPNKLIISVPPPYGKHLMQNDTNNSINIKNGSFSYTFETEFIIEKSWDKLYAPTIYGGSLSPFIYNGNAYVIGLAPHNQLYQYDFDNEKWSIISDYPGGYAIKSLTVVHNDVLYKIGGVYKSPVTYFWEFNFQNQTWTQKDDIPFEFRRASYFEIDEYLYILTNEEELWKYSYQTDTFEKLNDFPDEFFRFIHTYIINGDVYAATYDYTYKYHVETDSWTKIYSNPALSNYSEYNIFGFELYNTPYLYFDFHELYKYDKKREQWIYVTSYPWGSYKSNDISVFTFENRAYFITTNQGFFNNETYLYRFED